MTALAGALLGPINLIAKLVSKLANQIFVGTLEFSNRKSPILIHTPMTRAFGDTAEEIYFGLLKAKREGKKILFLCPHRSSSNFPAIVVNRELFNLESKYHLFSPNSPWRIAVDR